jgi:hypothetical protein
MKMMKFVGLARTKCTILLQGLMEDLVILTTILFENKIQGTNPELTVTSFCKTLTNMFRLCGSVDSYGEKTLGVNYLEAKELNTFFNSYFTIWRKCELF